MMVTGKMIAVVALALSAFQKEPDTEKCTQEDGKMAKNMQVSIMPSMQVIETSNNNYFHTQNQESRVI